MHDLAALGPRIVIAGNSNSGKSTLAMALGHKLELPPVHLDQFRHLPNSDWVRRPDVDFQQLHDAAIEGEKWVMEGNYSALMPQRLARATGLILLGDNRWANLRRYFWRTLVQQHRPGNLEGAKDSVKWLMIEWITIQSPRNLKRYRALLSATGLPCIEIRSMAELKRFYARWEL